MSMQLMDTDALLFRHHQTDGCVHDEREHLKNPLGVESTLSGCKSVPVRECGEPTIELHALLYN